MFFKKYFHYKFKNELELFSKLYNSKNLKNKNINKIEECDHKYLIVKSYNQKVGHVYCENCDYHDFFEFILK